MAYRRRYGSRRRRKSRGGKFTKRIRGGKVVKFRKGKLSGYKKVKYPRRGKNKKIIVRKVRIKRR